MSTCVPEERSTASTHALIGDAGRIEIGEPSPVMSVSPVVLRDPARIVDLQVRISAPTVGRDLPIILLSHGHGQSNHLSSLDGYRPLADFWAAHGFVVIQPTHLDSRTLNLAPNTPGAPLFWRSRVTDMIRILDHLDVVGAALPGLGDRMDPARVAVAGHSIGAHTAALLLGQRLTDPDDGSVVNLKEPRITAGVLLAAPGDGGSDLRENAARRFPMFSHPSFAEMLTPTLVIVADQDDPSYLTTRGPDWHADPYTLSTGPKCLLTLTDTQHGFGGISGYDAAETTDENVERVAAIQRLTWAYLRSALCPEDSAWTDARTAFAALSRLGRIECK